MIFELEDKYLPEVLEINKRENFFIPNINSPLVSVKAILVNKKGKIIGSAYVKTTCDLTISLDSSANEIEKAKALKETIEKLRPVLIAKGYDDCQVFCLNEEMAQSLEKHFEFKRSEGIAMHRRLLSGKGN